jgi:hypothetical protein
MRIVTPFGPMLQPSAIRLARIDGLDELKFGENYILGLLRSFPKRDSMMQGRPVSLC